MRRSKNEYCRPYVRTAHTARSAVTATMPSRTGVADATLRATRWTVASGDGRLSTVVVIPLPPPYCGRCFRLGPTSSVERRVTHHLRRYPTVLYRTRAGDLYPGV